MNNRFLEVDYAPREFTPEEIRRAQIAACSYADGDPEVAGRLLAMLGLLPVAEPDPEPAPVKREPERRPVLRWAAWMDDAACAGDDPELWHPDRDSDPAADARITCLSCPVRDKCGEHAAKNAEPHGVWGGYRMYEPTEKNALRRKHGLVVRERKTKQVMCACGTRLVSPNKRVCGPCREGYTHSRPAHEHLKKLKAAGMTRAEVAAAAGIPVGTVRSILAHEYDSMRAKVSDAILAIPVPEEAER
ncbi:WhiB family transcriptional regulator [Nocardia farcinica]|uniref:WhiB family transcriptional regulator n=1 Tax=Nocardia farcinica TaxID=37329 RepID=UPI001893449D|nr:WhiB family transcriptional regulator [Nocardia farcinica]MBF6584381.1 WhiB family transcriptional regulator [Nocardia farcinica]